MSLTLVALLAATLCLAGTAGATEDEERALRSEREWVVWQLGLADVVFVEGLRRGAVVGVAGNYWWPITLPRVIEMLSRRAIAEPDFDFLAELGMIRAEDGAYRQALRSRLAEIDVALAALGLPVPTPPVTAPPTPVTVPPAPTPAPVPDPTPSPATAWPPVHAGVPQDCGPRLDDAERIAMRDRFFEDYANSRWAAQYRWNDVRTHGIYQALRDLILKADYFQLHYAVNVPVWWARVLCADACVMGTPRPIDTAAAAEYRDCLAACERDIVFWRCDRDGTVIRAGSVIGPALR